MTAAMITDTRDWRRHAECRTADPEAFFPAAEIGPAYDEQVAAAKAFCAGCLVRTACLEFALTALAHGIAGGLTADERRALRTAGPYVDAMGRPIGAGRDDTAAVGRAQLAAGRRGRVVQHEFGASRRTVERWAAQARAARQQERDAGRGATAATGLPSIPPSSTTPRQGREPRKETDPSERNG
ncbi:WhiB family transcriptional regulator [Pseudonocardia saturnea]